MEIPNEALKAAAHALMDELQCRKWEDTRMFPLEDICEEHDAADWNDEMDACGVAVTYARTVLHTYPSPTDVRVERIRPVVDEELRRFGVNVRGSGVTSFAQAIVAEMERMN